MDQQVMKTLTGGKTCKLINETDLNSNKPTSFTAKFSGVSEVYCLFTGTVEFYGYYNGVGTVTVLVTNHEIVRYINIDNIQLERNQFLEPGTLIGKANKRKGLAFEYCTQWRGESKYPIRLNNRTYYKQNPIDLLNGLYIPPRELEVEYGINRPDDTVEFTKEQLSEWSDQTNPNDFLQIDENAVQITSLTNIPKSALEMLSYNGGGKDHSA